MWRTAFMVVGIPGILIALLVRFTLKEPIRGLSENRDLSDETHSSFDDVLGLLRSRRTFRHLAFADALNAFAGYSTASWTASFMIRSHGMTTGELGTWLAGTLGNRHEGHGTSPMRWNVSADSDRSEKRVVAQAPGARGMVECG